MAAAAAENAGNRGFSWWGILRPVITWFVISRVIGLLMNGMSGSSGSGGGEIMGFSSPLSGGIPYGSSHAVEVFSPNQYNADTYRGPDTLIPLVPKNSKMKLRVYLSDQLSIDPKSQRPDWEEFGIVFGDFSAKNSRSHQISIPLTESLQNNGTMYAHIYLESLYGKVYKRVNLVSYLFKPVTKTLINLSTGEMKNISYIPSNRNVPTLDSINSFFTSSLNPDDDAEKKGADQSSLDQGIPDDGSEYDVVEETPLEIISYFRPNLTLSLIDDRTAYPLSKTPSILLPYFDIGRPGKYLPILYVNDFWVIREHLIPLNSTVDSVTLSLDFAPMGKFKFQMFSSFEQSFSMQSSMGMMDSSDLDSTKKILLDTSPLYLGLTMTVSLLHTVFSFLTMKSDINFWKNNKSMKGLSLQVIFFRVFASFIIFLYLLDDPATSLFILVPIGLGIFVELWKVTKAADVSFGPEKWFGVIPKIHVNPKIEYVKSGTQKYDKQALYYLSFVMIPFVVAYSIYSYYYHTHRSTYSWLVKSASSIVYMSEFVFLFPQVLINYKLQSVEHLPWKVLVYRFFNSIIDDFWAFIVPMPTLHRVACFRDDIIFAILVYQRWIYNVDRSRDEYGDLQDESLPDGSASSQLVSGDVPAAAGTENETKKNK